MKMKKIISALAVGAVAVGFAAADLKITAASKLSTYMYSYNTEKSGGATAFGFNGTKQKYLFGLSSGGANSKGQAETSADVTLTASGNIFTFYTDIGVYADQPVNIPVKAMTIKAALGDFAFTTGWNRSGISNMSISDNASTNDEGRLNASVYKLGSPFEASPLWLSNNQAGFSKDPSNYFAHAKYSLGLGDTVTLNLAAAVISPHGTKLSFNDTSKDDGDIKGDNVEAVSGRPNGQDNTQMGWGVNVNPVIKKVVSVEAFAKGFGHKQGEDGHNFLLGGYAKLLAVPVLSNAVFGGSVWLDGHDGRTTLKEWNADLALALSIGNLSVSFNNKFEKQNKNLKMTAQNVGNGTKYDAQYILWDVVGVAFKLSDTFTLGAHVGQQSGFGDKNGGTTGTSIFVYPHVKASASNAASVSAGAVVTLDRIGTNTETNGTKKMGLLINVPVVVKIGL